VNAWRPSLSHLQEVEDFGTNPGALRMLTYLPDNLSPRPALVVVLHGSMQSAADYDLGAGWSTLADRYGGFAVKSHERRCHLFANPFSKCTDWTYKPSTVSNWALAHRHAAPSS
jgi:poly(3-hydroxybutyrate) depolymerase